MAATAIRITNPSGRDTITRTAANRLVKRGLATWDTLRKRLTLGKVTKRRQTADIEQARHMRADLQRRQTAHDYDRINRPLSHQELRALPFVGGDLTRLQVVKRRPAP